MNEIPLMFSALEIACEPSDIINNEVLRLLHFLAEYGYLFLKNLDNIYPFADRLTILERRNLICRYENPKGISIKLRKSTQRSDKM